MTKWYGNLINRVMENVKQAEPAVDMGATITAYSDRCAGTIVGFDPIKRIVKVQEDHATRTDKNGMSDSQSYDYSRNPNGQIWFFKRDKRGRYFEVSFNNDTKRWNKIDGGSGLIIGNRDKHYDYSF